LLLSEGTAASKGHTMDEIYDAALDTTWMVASVF
jgi:hypothetical protein